MDYSESLSLNKVSHSIDGAEEKNATLDEPPYERAKEDKKLEDLSRRLNEQAPGRTSFVWWRAPEFPLFTPDVHAHDSPPAADKSLLAYSCSESLHGHPLIPNQRD